MISGTFRSTWKMHCMPKPNDERIADDWESVALSRVAARFEELPAPPEEAWRLAAALLSPQGAARPASVATHDLTLICEGPRIAPHREAMRARLAQLLDVDTGAVSVKATTTEGLGFAGRNEGIAAQAVVSLVAIAA